MRFLPAVSAVALMTFALVANAQVHKGESAPLFFSVDENMRRIDMADAIDGRPLVFWATSAT